MGSINEANPYVIMGRELVASLGLDAANACAAARADFIRVSPLDVEVVDEEGEPVPLMGHQVPIIAKGYAGDALLIRLLGATLKNLQPQLDVIVQHGMKVGLYLCLPDERTCFQQLDELVSEGIRFILEDKAQSLAEVPLAQRVTSIAQRAVMDAGITLNFQSVYGYTNLTATDEAFQRSADALAAGEIDVAIVGGVDALTGSDRLHWLLGMDRLQTAEKAAGLVPGEACGLLLIAAAHTAGQLGMASVGKLTGAAAVDTSPVAESSANNGKNITQAVSAILPSNEQVAWVISNQDGSEAKAMDFGTAITRLNRYFSEFSPSIWYPAISFGETGLAAHFVSIIMAITANERGRALDKKCVVISADETTATALSITF